MHFRKEGDEDLKRLGLWSHRSTTAASISLRLAAAAVQYRACREVIPLQPRPGSDIAAALCHILLVASYDRQNIPWEYSIAGYPQTGRPPLPATHTELKTKDENQYTFFRNTKGHQFFRIRTNSINQCQAQIALTTNNYITSDNVKFEIILGESNNQSTSIIKNNMTSESTFAPTPDLLSTKDFRGFWIFWKNMVIQVGKENELEPFITLKDEDIPAIKYIGVCTVGSTGTWIIEEPHYQCWVNATEGLVPPAAFSGGEDKREPIYVIRANCHGGLVPGKLISSQGVAFVPSDGAENACHEYEVLCEFRGQWMRCAENEIPINAVTGGYSADGETFYIGRVRHEGLLIIGKVCNGVCYAGYKGMELSFNKYEILIT